MNFFQKLAGGGGTGPDKSLAPMYQMFQMMQMQQNMEMAQKKEERDAAMQKMLLEEHGLNIRKQTKLLDEADKLRQEWDKYTAPTTKTVTESNPNWGIPYDATEGLPAMVSRDVTTSPLDETFGKMAPFVRVMGPEGLKTLAPLMVKQENPDTQWKMIELAAQGNPVAQKMLEIKSGMGQPKTVNMPNWYDSLGQAYFPDYATNIDSQKAWGRKYAEMMSTPQGSKELLSKASLIAQSTAAPSISYLQTANGFAPAITRGPGAGTIGPSTEVQKPLTGEMITSEQQIGTLKETLSAMKAVYDKKYVGPYAGRLGGIKETTTGLDDNEALFRSRVAQLQNSLIYLMSGKQINENEYQRLKKQIPDVNLPVSVFEARMAEFERTVDSIIANRHKNMGAYGGGNGYNGNGNGINGATGKVRPPLDSFVR